MSGAVMLLMAATVGITYGWTPDGGNGVKYIIQIPPEKMEQVARTGEISSQIPAEIRGHVSEVVVRVGNGNLPRVTPQYSSSQGAPAGELLAGAGSFSTVAAADQIPMPIPSMGDPSDLRPIRAGGSAPTAMMKPAPQSGGMNMPSGFGMTPASSSAPPGTGYSNTGYGSAPPPSTSPNTGYSSASLEQAAREAANNAAQQFSTTADASRQQLQQNLNTNAERMGDAANAQFQSVANGVQDAANGMMYGPALPPSSADDPRNRLTQSGSPAPPPMTSTSAASGPSTAPFSPSTNYAGTPSNRASSLPPNMAASTPATTTYNSPVSTPALNATTRDEEWYALQNGSQRRPSTAPIGNSASAFAGGNFGQLPAGLQPASSSPASSSPAGRPSPASTGGNYTSSGAANDFRQTATVTNELDYDPNLSAAQAARLPKTGYSYDAEGYPVDRQGYRLDRYGRRVDRQGQLLTAVDTIGDSNSSQTGAGEDSGTRGNYAAGGSYNPPRLPANSAAPPLVQPPRDRFDGANPEQDRYPRNPDSQLAGLTGGNSNEYLDAGTVSRGDTRPRPREDDLGSSSDGQSLRDRLEGKATSPGAAGVGEFDGAPEQVAAQPIFNALLLLSVVANLYLLFWLKNLRVQFRDMVAAKRASVTGGSLATGV